jgi:hypothetical protein
VGSDSEKAWDNEYFKDNFAGKIAIRHEVLAGHG